MLRRPSISPFFPYTTLFRSRDLQHLLGNRPGDVAALVDEVRRDQRGEEDRLRSDERPHPELAVVDALGGGACGDRKSTRLNSSHLGISYAVFCLKKKKQETI